ncbi:hypothetical protein ABIE59_003323 [Marinobacter sp. MBR-99]|jgi:hypothetical protein|uniref:BACON domain-containing protein n=1 Tax=Marinobacter sp. MBR-99 TaxID=3156461 RepID=UPI003395362A
MNKVLLTAFTLLLFTMLSACGGGDGGDSDGGSKSSKYSVSLSPGSINFSYSIGGTIPDSQTVEATFNGDGLIIGHAPGVTRPDWLTVQQVNSSDTSSPVEVELSVNPSILAAGTYTTSVRFVTGDPETEEATYVDLPVTMVIDRKLSLSQTEIEFSHLNGAVTAPDAQSIDILGNTIDWQATASEDWVSLGTSSGTAPSTLDISVQPDQITETGLYTAIVAVENQSSGQTEEIAIELYIDPRLLLIDDNGVALTSFPTAAEASSFSVKVRDNAGESIPWSATSSQSWLSVTAAGTTDGNLTLNADPTGLTSDTIHYADVFVTSANPLVENTETVRVGYYVSSADPTATTVGIPGLYIAADPIRPYVYLTDEGTDVSIYNIYTGAFIGSVTAGTELKAMTISSDGGTLYVIDGFDERIVPVDLITLDIGPKWPANRLSLDPSMLEYTRINGKPVVLTDRYDIFDASSGEQVAMLPVEYVIGSSVVGASGDGKAIYEIQSSVSGELNLTRYVTGYSAVRDQYNITRTHRLPKILNSVEDLAVNSDGSKIYLAARSEDTFPTFLFANDALTEGSILPGASYPNAVELGPTDKFYAGIEASNDPDDPDILSYFPDDSADTSVIFSGTVRKRQVQISGDGHRTIAVTYSSTMEFNETTP